MFTFFSDQWSDIIDFNVKQNCNSFTLICKKKQKCLCLIVSFYNDLVSGNLSGTPFTGYLLVYEKKYKIVIRDEHDCRNNVELLTSPANSALPSSDRVIKAHPDFRMVILANRPGFPFLGNDFFGAMGKFLLIKC